MGRRITYLIAMDKVVGLVAQKMFIVAQDDHLISCPDQLSVRSVLR
jgi:hypothetical protein